MGFINQLITGGHNLVCYGKWPVVVNLPTYKVMIFHIKLLVYQSVERLFMRVVDELPH